MLAEQRIRAVLFYLSVVVFCLGLPLILSFSLSYKFDNRTFRFTKTGLIAVKTQPSQANVYLNHNLLQDKSPLTVNELMPGTYRLDIELDKYYPWTGQVKVEAGRVSRVEKVILFPVISAIKKINHENASLFLMDEDRGALYYVNLKDLTFFKTDRNGENDEQIGSLMKLESPPKKFVLSPDREKIIYYSKRQIGISYFIMPAREGVPEKDFILTADRPIINAFWHSDNYHFVLVTDKSIEIWEARPEAAPLILVDLNKKDTEVVYAQGEDALYFTDTQKGADGNLYDNLYKLELNTKLFDLQHLIKMRPVEQNER